MRLYQAIATTLDALARCTKAPQLGHAVQLHKERLARLTAALPSGSGIDTGTRIDVDASNAAKLVLTCAFHHMNEHGYYDGWTQHTIVVRPSLSHGIEIRVTGRDRNDIKEYLGEVYRHALTEEAPRPAGSAEP